MISTFVFCPYAFFARCHYRLPRYICTVVRGCCGALRSTFCCARLRRSLPIVALPLPRVARSFATRYVLFTFVDRYALPMFAFTCSVAAFVRVRWCVVFVLRVALLPYVALLRLIDLWIVCLRHCALPFPRLFALPLLRFTLLHLWFSHRSFCVAYRAAALPRGRAVFRSRVGFYRCTLRLRCTLPLCHVTHRYAHTQIGSATLPLRYHAPFARLPCAAVTRLLPRFVWLRAFGWLLLPLRVSLPFTLTARRHLVLGSHVLRFGLPRYRAVRAFAPHVCSAHTPAVSFAPIAPRIALFTPAWFNTQLTHADFARTRVLSVVRLIVAFDRYLRYAAVGSVYALFAFLRYLRATPFALPVTVTHRLRTRFYRAAVAVHAFRLPLHCLVWMPFTVYHVRLRAPPLHYYLPRRSTGLPALVAVLRCGLPGLDRYCSTYHARVYRFGTLHTAHLPLYRCRSGVCHRLRVTPLRLLPARATFAYALPRTLPAFALPHLPATSLRTRVRLRLITSGSCRWCVTRLAVRFRCTARRSIVWLSYVLRPFAIVYARTFTRHVRTVAVHLERLLH